ncbi:hypothetical protein [Paraburkholderia sp. BCC1884]|uniref:hypothetical protein n=1 Tax=Paraburkholderia sp. BCC1884 TaxID=2562668 RepID=UPI00118375D9|nr:hypothetical protein [Paraburkholderia sp. BCC1884]
MSVSRWVVLFLTACQLTCLMAAQPVTTPPVPKGIPIDFTLDHAGYVTLVIEEAACARADQKQSGQSAGKNDDGRRVRNLVSEQFFPAGKNTVQWDGLDDLQRDTDAAAHGQYYVPGRLVAAGCYRVRGLVRPAITLEYQFNPYSPGRPPWQTKEPASEWLATHSAPGAILFVPPGATPARPGAPGALKGQVLVGSYVSEGGSGLAWLDLAGRKVWGQVWLGGLWTGATQLARDTGTRPAANVYAYAATSWSGDQHDGQPELRLSALLSKSGAPARANDPRFGTGEDAPLSLEKFDLPALSPSPHVDLAYPERSESLTGLAAYNGLVVVAMRQGGGRLLFIGPASNDVTAKRKVMQTIPLADPRGLAFDTSGKLLALSGKQLVRIEVKYAGNTVTVSEPVRVVTGGLDDPQNIALDPAGNLYVSDWGQSHQVKVFAPDGKPLRVIGHAGPPTVGTYDPAHMNHPAGLTLDNQGRLWVAENDKMPKRVSLWDAATGRFIQAFYGPPQYGGGGSLDPNDKSRFFYADDGGAMGIKLDWQAGTGVPEAIYYRAEQDTTGLVGSENSDTTVKGGMPDYPLYRNGQLFLTNANSAKVSGRPSIVIWHVGKENIARPVAAAGSTLDVMRKLLPAFQSAAMRARMPATLDPQSDALLFVWSDTNGNGRVDPDEVTFLAPVGAKKGDQRYIGNVTVQDDLSLTIAYAGDVARSIPVSRLTPQNVPVYNIGGSTVLADKVQAQLSTGGGQVLLGKDDWNVFTTPPAPLAPESLAGNHRGRAVWSYPDLWPGLHASHNMVTAPDRPGELVGTTRVLGNPVAAPAPSDAGQLWAINGNNGSIYLFTMDGLFVATLFKDAHEATEAPPAEARRGMDMNGTSLLYENFHPTMTRTSDGNVYLQAGASAPLMRIAGLERIKRLPDQRLAVSDESLLAAQRWAKSAPAPDTKPTVLDVEDRLAGSSNADAANWPNAATQWAKIDTRTVKSGDWGQASFETRAALAVLGDRLHIAMTSDTSTMLDNSGISLQNLFATGGGIDLMLGTDPKAPAGRTAAVAGDERLLVSRVRGQTVALLYQPIASSRGGAPVTFTSPLRTLQFARMDNVSKEVSLTVTKVPATSAGAPESFVYRIDVPLKVLNLSAAPGTTLTGDIGVLRGNGFQTLQRVYWSSKASGLLSDLPGEAELTPGLWGHFRFVAPGK